MTAAKIELPPLKTQTVQFMLVGDSPLIVHRWSEKAKREILDKHMKRATSAKQAKDPEEDYRSSLYMIEGGGYGFPANGVKAAMVGACRFVEMKMTEARGAFHVEGEMLQIHGEPRPREDMVRVGMGKPDIRYRGEFVDWRLPVLLKFMPDVLSAEQIANLLNVAGFAIGIGEWRPEKSGSFGRFHVATEGDLA